MLNEQMRMPKRKIMKLLVFFLALGLSMLANAQETMQFADNYTKENAIAAIENVYITDSLGFSLKKYVNAQQTISLIMNRTEPKEGVYAHYNDYRSLPHNA